jgi:hypothetical protein
VLLWRLLGNSFIDSPHAIIDRCLGDFFVIIAKEIGFDKLYERAEADGIDLSQLPHFNEVTTVCQICSQIHRNPKLLETLKPTIESMDIEYCLARLDAIESEMVLESPTKEV